MGGYSTKGASSTGISPFDWVDRESNGESYASAVTNHRKYLTAEEAKLLFTVSKNSQITA